MTTQELYDKNKRCFQRIKELEKERQELESLIAENLIQIYDATQEKYVTEYNVYYVK